MNTSRATTSSFSMPSISGVTGRPLFWICALSRSTRALGTGLPLTMATFCAAAGRAAANVAAATAAMRSCFIGGRKRVRVGSGCLDGEGVYAALHEIAQGIIHKAMLRDPGAAGEERGGDPHAEMRAGAGAVRACMARVLEALVDDFDVRRLQLLAQALLERLGRDAGAHSS